MSAAPRINPEVSQSLADLSGARVQEDVAINYPHNFWSALKSGHYRFALAGAAVETPIAAAIGAAVALIFGGPMGLVVPAFAAAGALMGMEMFGASGSAAASRAAGLAEKHARVLDADALGKTPLNASDDKLLANGRGMHYEFSQGRDNGKWFNWKSGLIGGAIAAGVGGILGLGMASTGAAAAAESIPVVGAIAAAVSATPAVALAVAGAAVFALFGLTFGIERHVVKSVLNQTDANIEGKLRFAPGPDLGRAQSLESDDELMRHRLRRQAEIKRLEKDYNERISWGAIRGRFRGLAGAVPGALAGAAAGVIALAGIAATGGLAATAAAMHMAAPMIVPLFASAGALLGIHSFGESGMEAGAESTARAIDNEFERNRALRAQGLTPPEPKEARGKGFNARTMLLAGAMGAAVGAAMFLSLGAALVPMAHVAATAALGLSTLVGGLIGASYGIGEKTEKAMAKPFTWAYDKAIGAREKDEGIGLPLKQSPPAPDSAIDQNRVTAEDIAMLNQRLAANNGERNFVKTLGQQHMQLAVTVR